jgi:UDP-glucose 4-epimerase
MSRGKRSLVVVTGAIGFIGRAYCARAKANGVEVRKLVRKAQAAGDVGVDLVRATPDQLVRALDGARAVVHLAARVHVMNETPGANTEAAYRLANVDATERLAIAAATAGARRFVFASTVKVNGEATLPGRPFRPGDAPEPHDAYARSKLAAERTLAQVSSGTSMLATNLRLPLVYGAGAKGNFRRLVDAVAARRVLPVAGIDNRRSFVGLDNLLDAIDAVLAAESGVLGTHFVADAQSVSTPDLVRAIADALGVRARLVAIPPSMLKLAGLISGRGDTIARLTDSLEVDTTSLARATAWRPRPFAIDAATLARDL